MRVSRFQKSLAFLLALILPAQTVLAALGESQIWSEQRHALQSQKEMVRSYQVASLPNALPSANSIINDTQLNKPLFSSSQWQSDNRWESLTLNRKLRLLVHGISHAHGTIQDVYDSKNTNAHPLLIIQDIHLNEEAQSHIAGLLTDLIDSDMIQFVGIEGSFDPFDFSRFRAFPDKSITGFVADSFLKHDLLSGPSYAGMMSEKNPPLFLGVDHLPSYKENVTAYWNSLEQKKVVQNYLSQFERSLIEEKKKSFSADLLALDGARVSYHEGELGIASYVKRLVETGVSTDFIIDQFIEASNLESSVNFQKADHERKLVLEKLTGRLNKSELQDLLDRSLAYRMGHMNFGAYYRHFKNLCSEKGVQLHRWPAFDNYIRYVLLSDGIQAAALFKSLSQLEEKAFLKLAKTKREKELLSQSLYTSLVKKLIRFELTPDQWERYKNYRNNMLLSHGIGDLKSFEEFYEQADIRSRHMVQNLPKEKTTVLVVGGFHTAEITDQLKESKRSFVVVTPKVTKLTNKSESSYLSIFAQEKASLNELFKGEKLFLPHARLNNVGATGVSGAAAMVVTKNGLSQMAARHQEKHGYSGDSSFEVKIEKLVAAVSEKDGDKEVVDLNVDPGAAAAKKLQDQNNEKNFSLITPLFKRVLKSSFFLSLFKSELNPKFDTRLYNEQRTIPSDYSINEGEDIVKRNIRLLLSRDAEKMLTESGVYRHGGRTEEYQFAVDREGRIVQIAYEKHLRDDIKAGIGTDYYFGFVISGVETFAAKVENCENRDLRNKINSILWKSIVDKKKFTKKDFLPESAFENEAEFYSWRNKLRENWANLQLEKKWIRSGLVPILEFWGLPGIGMAVDPVLGYFGMPGLGELLGPILGPTVGILFAGLLFSLIHGRPGKDQTWQQYIVRALVSSIITFLALTPDFFHLSYAFQNISQFGIGIGIGLHGLWNRFVSKKWWLTIKNSDTQENPAGAFATIDNFLFTRTSENKVPISKNTVGFDLRQSTDEDSYLPGKPLVSTGFVESNELGTIIEAATGEFVYSNENAIFSIGHYLCVSGDLHFVKNGKSYQGHFHIFPENTAQKDATENSFDQINKILGYLKKEGFEHIELSLSFSDSLPGFNISPGRLKRKLQDLARNANLKFKKLNLVRHGGPVRVDSLSTPKASHFRFKSGNNIKEIQSIPWRGVLDNESKSVFLDDLVAHLKTQPVHKLSDIEREFGPASRYGKSSEEIHAAIKEGGDKRLIKPLPVNGNGNILIKVEQKPNYGTYFDSWYGEDWAYINHHFVGNRVPWELSRFLRLVKGSVVLSDGVKHAFLKFLDGLVWRRPLNETKSLIEKMSKNEIILKTGLLYFKRMKLRRNLLSPKYLEAEKEKLLSEANTTPSPNRKSSQNVSQLGSVMAGGIVFSVGLGLIFSGTLLIPFLGSIAAGILVVLLSVGTTFSTVAILGPALRMMSPFIFKGQRMAESDFKQLVRLMGHTARGDPTISMMQANPESNTLLYNPAIFEKLDSKAIRALLHYHEALHFSRYQTSSRLLNEIVAYAAYAIKAPLMFFDPSNSLKLLYRRAELINLFIQRIRGENVYVHLEDFKEDLKEEMVRRHGAETELLVEEIFSDLSPAAFRNLVRFLKQAQNMDPDQMIDLVCLLLNPRVADEGIDLFEMFIERNGANALVARSNKKGQIFGVLGELSGAQVLEEEGFHVDQFGGKNKSEDGKEFDHDIVLRRTKNRQFIVEVKNDHVHASGETNGENLSESVQQWVVRQQGHLNNLLEKIKQMTLYTGVISPTKDSPLDEDTPHIILVVKDIAKTPEEKNLITEALEKYKTELAGRISSEAGFRPIIDIKYFDHPHLLFDAKAENVERDDVQRGIDSEGQSLSASELMEWFKSFSEKIREKGQFLKNQIRDARRQMLRKAGRALRDQQQATALVNEILGRHPADPQLAQKELDDILHRRASVPMPVIQIDDESPRDASKGVWGMLFATIAIVSLSLLNPTDSYIISLLGPVAAILFLLYVSGFKFGFSFSPRVQITQKGKKNNQNVGRYSLGLNSEHFASEFISGRLSSQDGLYKPKPVDGDLLSEAQGALYNTPNLSPLEKKARRLLSNFIGQGAVYYQKNLGGTARSEIINGKYRILIDESLKPIFENPDLLGDPDRHLEKHPVHYLLAAKLLHEAVEILMESSDLVNWKDGKDPNLVNTEYLAYQAEVRLLRQVPNFIEKINPYLENANKAPLMVFYDHVLNGIPEHQAILEYLKVLGFPVDNYDASTVEKLKQHALNVNERSLFPMSYSDRPRKSQYSYPGRFADQKNFTPTIQEKGWGILQTKNFRINGYVQELEDAYNKVYTRYGNTPEPSRRVSIAGVSKNAGVNKAELEKDVLEAVWEWANFVLGELQKSLPDEPLVISNVAIGKDFQLGLKDRKTGKMVTGHIDNRPTYLHATNTLRGPSTVLYPNSATPNGLFISENLGEPVSVDPGVTTIITGLSRSILKKDVNATVHGSPEEDLNGRLTLFLSIHHRDIVIESGGRLVKRWDQDFKMWNLKRQAFEKFYKDDPTKREENLKELQLETQSILREYNAQLSSKQKKELKKFLNPNSLGYLLVVLPVVQRILNNRFSEKTVNRIVTAVTLGGAVVEGLLAVATYHNFGIGWMSVYLISLYALHLIIEWIHPNDAIRAPPTARLGWNVVRLAVFGLYLVPLYFHLSPLYALPIHLLFDVFIGVKSWISESRQDEHESPKNFEKSRLGPIREIRPGYYVIDDRLAAAMALMMDHIRKFSARFIELDKLAPDFVEQVTELSNDIFLSQKENYLERTHIFTLPKSGLAPLEQIVLEALLPDFLGADSSLSVEELMPVLTARTVFISESLVPSLNEGDIELIHEEHHRLWGEKERRDPDKIKYLDDLFTELIKKGLLDPLLSDLLIKAHYPQLSAEEFWISAADNDAYDRTKNQTSDEDHAYFVSAKIYEAFAHVFVEAAKNDPGLFAKCQWALGLVKGHRKEAREQAEITKLHLQQQTPEGNDSLSSWETKLPLGLIGFFVGLFMSVQAWAQSLPFNNSNTNTIQYRQQQAIQQFMNQQRPTTVAPNPIQPPVPMTPINPVQPVRIPIDTNYLTSGITYTNQSTELISASLETAVNSYYEEFFRLEAAKAPIIPGDLLRKHFEPFNRFVMAYYSDYIPELTSLKLADGLIQLFDILDGLSAWYARQGIYFRVTRVEMPLYGKLQDGLPSWTMASIRPIPDEAKVRLPRQKLNVRFEAYDNYRIKPLWAYNNSGTKEPAALSRVPINGQRTLHLNLTDYKAEIRDYALKQKQNVNSDWDLLLKQLESANDFQSAYPLMTKYLIEKSVGQFGHLSDKEFEDKVLPIFLRRNIYHELHHELDLESDPLLFPQFMPFETYKAIIESHAEAGALEFTQVPHTLLLDNVTLQYFGGMNRNAAVRLSRTLAHLLVNESRFFPKEKINEINSLNNPIKRLREFSALIQLDVNQLNELGHVAKVIFELPENKTKFDLDWNSPAMRNLLNNYEWNAFKKVEVTSVPQPTEQVSPKSNIVSWIGNIVGIGFLIAFITLIFKKSPAKKKSKSKGKLSLFLSLGLLMYPMTLPAAAFADLGSNKPLVKQSVDDSAKLLADVITAAAKNDNAETLRLIQGMPVWEVGEMSAASESVFIQDWDGMLNDPTFVNKVKNHLGDGIDLSAVSENALLAQLMTRLDFSINTDADITTGVYANAKRIFVMNSDPENRESKTEFIAAIRKTGLTKETDIYVPNNKEAIAYYQDLIDELNKLGGKLTLAPYDENADVGVTDSEFNPNRFQADEKVANNLNAFLFILGTGLSYKGQAKNIRMWDQLLPPFVRNQLRNIGQFIRQVLTAA